KCRHFVALLVRQLTKLLVGRRRFVVLLNQLAFTSSLLEGKSELQALRLRLRWLTGASRQQRDKCKRHEGCEALAHGHDRVEFRKCRALCPLRHRCSNSIGKNVTGVPRQNV